MSHKTLLVLAAALGIAACADAGREPVSPAVGGPSFIAMHGSIDEPAVSGEASGNDVTLSWTWSDPEDAWDLVSFEVTRDGVELPVEVDNAKPYTAGVTLERSIMDEDLAPGTYEYCVEVMAKWMPPAGTPSVTNHSKSCVTVQVGHRYSIEIQGGDVTSTAHNANSANFTIEYVLRDGGEIVGCTTAVDVMMGATAPKNSGCDPLTSIRTVIFPNPTPGTPGTFDILFSVDGELVLDFAYTTQTVGGGPGGSKLAPKH